MSLNHDKTSQDSPTSTSQDSPSSSSSSSKWEESMDLTPWEESMDLTPWEEWMDLTPGESSAEEDSDLQQNTVTSTVAEVQITDAAPPPPPPPPPPHPALEVTIITEGNSNPAPKAAAAANAGETEPAIPTTSSSSSSKREERVDLTLESSSEEDFDIEWTYMRAYECFYCRSLFISTSLMTMKSHAQSAHPDKVIIVRDHLAYKAKMPSKIYLCYWVGCLFNDLDHMVYLTHLNAHQNGNK